MCKKCVKRCSFKKKFENTFDRVEIVPKSKSFKLIYDMDPLDTFVLLSNYFTGNLNNTGVYTGRPGFYYRGHFQMQIALKWTKIIEES
jgi:hypothetical protein